MEAIAMSTTIPVEQAPAPKLSARESEVLTLMCDGHTNSVMAGMLSISVKTIEAHRARIFKKLEAKNSAQCVVKAIRAGLVKI